MSSSLPTELVADVTSCTLLGVSGGAPSAESVDYVENKKQFQLHSMLTEQRHPRTTTMSQTIAKDAAAGLQQILSVDEDIVAKMAEIVSTPAELAKVRSLQEAMLRAVRDKRKIYVYGCGATGRLAKLMESTFWRPFWSRLSTSPQLAEVWARVQPLVSPSVVDDLIGEMTGGDRALISALEGFEDLQLIGRLQLRDRGVQRGDVVVAVTEGGETSSVIGTVLGALDQYRAPGASADTPLAADVLSESASRLFFVYNNPDHLLAHFHRSARVINEAGITKLNLSTGPQAITGSTRMQATSSETFVIAAALHAALDSFLREDVKLSPQHMALIGFAADKPTSLESKLGEYPSLLSSVTSSAGQLGLLTQWESATYSAGHFSTYFAPRNGLMTVFIDNTERSPTFRLYALDTLEQTDARRCFLQVWTSAPDQSEAWGRFLGRSFRGLEDPEYARAFNEEIEDQYLRATALRSLPNAGDKQAALYDFSFSAANCARRGGVRAGDLGVMVLVGAGELDALVRDAASDASKFVEMHVGKGAPAQGEDGLPTRVALIVMNESTAVSSSAEVQASIEKELAGRGLPADRICVVVLTNSPLDDPLHIRSQTALKVALNAHSTGVMARLGKVLGNSMVNVSPSNLKLIGRATALVLNHVNPAAQKAGLPTVSYALVNAVLYDSIECIKAEQAKAGSVIGSQSAEVALCIVRILSSLAAGKAVSAEESLKVLADKGLGAFLEEFDAQHGGAK